MPIVQYLVSKDPAVCRITLVDCKGKTPLHMAAKRNHAHLVSFLLEKVSLFPVFSTLFLVMKCDETHSLFGVGFISKSLSVHFRVNISLFVLQCQSIIGTVPFWTQFHFDLANFCQYNSLKMEGKN